MLGKVNILRVIAPPSRLGICCLHWSSKRIRSSFIDYFKALDHHHVRSSPVIPWNDPTLTFVNAGMNQFKPVFLGHTQRAYPCATSSQKCIRVGGKHNDLTDVGNDSYHHTFFEMLGNWSFGDYFKKEACSMAWTLLTEVYQLPPNRLYVTYFGGDETMGLDVDNEVKDIWRSLGVADNRIIPFGMKENFWEMGMYGPCGPCTEIHYDRLGHSLASDRVNLGVEDLIELWNVVFIQYERLKDGSLKSLDTYYVDTGMGLERITAVLNNKISNYDTDLFMPIFSAIEKMSGRSAYTGKFSEDGRCLDTAYRILADHVRMFTVALADGMFPEDSHKLRRIIRRAINIGGDQFGFLPGKNCLIDLTCIVAESLGETYTELCDQLAKVHIILDHEEKYFYEIQEKLSRDWKDLLLQRPELKTVSDLQTPGMIEGIREITGHIQEWKNYDCKLPGNMAFKLYDTYGLHADLIEELAEIYGLTVDEEGFQLTLDKSRQKTKIIGQKRLETFKKEELLNNLVALNLPVTDDSAKYQYRTSNARYQFTPVKTTVLLLLQDGKLIEKVTGGKRVGVLLEASNFYHEAGGQEGDTGRLSTNNAEIDITGVDNISGYVIHWGILEKGEVAVGDTVTATICETRRIGCMQHHSATHLLNSALKALTGLSCQKSSHVAPDYFYIQIRTYQALDHDIIHKTEEIIKRWIAMKSPINRRTMNITEMLQEPNITLLPGEVYPDTVHLITTKLVDDGDISKEDEFLMLSSAEPCCGTHLCNTGDIGNFIITNIMVNEMKNIIELQQDGPILHLMQTNFGTSKAVLSKATALAKQRPILVLAKSEGVIKGRATIPEEFLSCGASATAWMTCVSEVLGGRVKAPRGQNPLLVCNFRSKKTDFTLIETKLREALKSSKDYIDDF
ncbi:alanine--tRNA ligase, mitochondrial-like isoform X2 [Homarus americanus]|uniref:alanine--tRNA ligase, mitochondrial-like isoform X2 n=1 Tax=Homarus americanus TaxID=6706 RepID=UPI001C44B5FA|nr:alanine--tRNA ligase, mitochondrial-like isoform X2 [Homarus americanus]